MEEMYRVDPGSMSCSNEFGGTKGNLMATTSSTDHGDAQFHIISNPPPDHHHQEDSMLLFQITDHHHRHHAINGSHNNNSSTLSHLIKTQIANHPRYPNLLSAYIDCQKVGAPPEMASLLEDISRERKPMNTASTTIGADPELDEFMDSYCEILHRYKEELSKPFDEATTFLTSIESQLSSLCKGTVTKSMDSRSDEVGGTSEELSTCGEVEAAESQESCVGRSGDQDLKGMLLRKYSGYLSNLRKEFLKKKKKSKLPKDARMTLLDWWNNHYRWPYPTEDEKLKLSEITGLDQKQINNWFINQRKRHWKPSEDMRSALIEGVSGNIRGSFYLNSGGSRNDEAN